MKRILLSLLLLVMCQSALAAWEEVGSDDTMTVYVDTDTLIKKGNKVKIWWLFDLSEEEVVDGISQMSMKYISEFDCVKKQSRQLYASSHSEAMGEGETVSINYDSMKWKPIDTESLDQSVFDAACVEE